jgi:hypothetical protein
MGDQGFFSRPSDEAKERMLKAAGRTIKTTLNLWTGVGGDLAELAWGYVTDHYKERNKRRAEEFKARIEKAGPKVQEVIESPQQSEPLFDVFLCVYRECLNDDEDEKVSYYASFMALLAVAQEPKPSHAHVMAILAAIRDLRAHDLRTLALFGRRSSHQNGENLGQLEARVGHMATPSNVSRDLLLQSVSALIRHGLVTMTPFGLNAMVNADLHYKITEFGRKFGDFISANPSAAE